MSDVDGVIRHYEGALKKHQNRIIRLDARGVGEDFIGMMESRRAAAKYRIVLEALKLLRATENKVD